jgi:dephospho-CoA kinase
MSRPRRSETAKRSPFVIGVTGNIACGKSLVTSILHELGAETIDADHVAHELMQPGSPVLQSIAKRFGPEVLNEDGSLNRPALGKIVFSDPEALADLERLTHPETVRTILDRAKAAHVEIVVIDAIKLFEAGLAEHCDETWAVFCDPAQQLERLMARNGLSESDARQRIDAQPPQAEKRLRADAVIDNSGTREETRRQTEREWARITRNRTNIS